MVMDKQHKDALESCIDCIRKGYSLAIWIAFGIPDEDRIKIINLANERLSNEEPLLFNEPDFVPKVKC